MNNNLRFFQPKSLSEAIVFLAKNPGARILAGGTDLLVKWKNGLLPKLTCFVDIGKLNLNIISIGRGVVRIGSGCTMSQIAEDPRIKKRFPTLVSAALGVGAYQIRNMATIGGNISNASPAGDTIPALMSLDAFAVIRGWSKTKKVELSEFFTGPGKSVLSRGEVIEAFELPDHPTKGVFLKLGERQAHAISKVSLAFSTWKIGENRQAYRLALGAVAPTVIRCRRAETLLEGVSGLPSKDIIDQVVKLCCEEAIPIDDIRSTRAFRKKMVGVLCRRALEKN